MRNGYIAHTLKRKHTSKLPIAEVKKIMGKAFVNKIYVDFYRKWCASRPYYSQHPAVSRQVEQPRCIGAQPKLKYPEVQIVASSAQRALAIVAQMAVEKQSDK